MNGQPIASARWADPDYIETKYFYKPGDIWIGRNPHDYTSAIGYGDDKHVIVCAGSGAGKGRSFIVNNLALWPGSTVVYDPKGELPEILAARRGEGDKHCVGLGQKVYVLDPLNHSNVDDRYRAFFDPLHALDPDDGELQTWTKRLAQALIKLPESGGEAIQWAKRAQRFVALVITHVVTSDLFDDHERNLATVHRLVTSGMYDYMHEYRERQKGLPPEQRVEPDEFVVLIEMMRDNNACRGWITREAVNLLRQMKKTERYMESVRGEASDQLSWLKSDGIEISLTGGLDHVPKLSPKSQFHPEKLKKSKKGVSVFIVMPTDDLETYAPWVQVIFIGIFAAMRRVKGKPKAGPVLGLLDEFSSLGYQDYIATSLDNIRGAGMKLAIIVQNFGTLKQTYQDKMESFFTNAGLELYFGRIGTTALEYVTKELGDTEVVRLARSETHTESVSATQTESVSFGETDTLGGSESFTEGQSSSQSTSRNWGWSDSVNWSDSKNWGRSDGKNMGVNYGPHVFFRGLSKSTNYGTNLSRNSGGSHTEGGSKVRSGGKTESQSNTVSASQTRGSSWSSSKSRTESYSSARTEGYSIAGGVAETFHKKPLLEPHEYNSYLRSFPDSERDDPAYPGFALVRIQGESPFFVRRSNYDQDEYFARCFTPDNSFEFLALEYQPLLGCQYTEDHIFDLKLPELLAENNIYARPLVRAHEWIEDGASLLKFSGHQFYEYKSPESGRVLLVNEPEQQTHTRSIMHLRFAEPLDDEDRDFLNDEAFGDVLHSARLGVEKRDKARQAAERAKARQAEIEAELKQIQDQQIADRQRAAEIEDNKIKIVRWSLGVGAAIVIVVLSMIFNA